MKKHQKGYISKFSLLISCISLVFTCDFNLQISKESSGEYSIGINSSESLLFKDPLQNINVILLNEETLEKSNELHIDTSKSCNVLEPFMNYYENIGSDDLLIVFAQDIKKECFVEYEKIQKQYGFLLQTMGLDFTIVDKYDQMPFIAMGKKINFKQGTFQSVKNLEGTKNICLLEKCPTQKVGALCKDAAWVNKCGNLLGQLDENTISVDWKILDQQGFKSNNNNENQKELQHELQVLYKNFDFDPDCFTQHIYLNGNQIETYEMTSSQKDTLVKIEKSTQELLNLGCEPKEDESNKEIQNLYCELEVDTLWAGMEQQTYKNKMQKTIKTSILAQARANQQQQEKQQQEAEQKKKKKEEQIDSSPNQNVEGEKKKKDNEEEEKKKEEKDEKINRFSGTKNVVRIVMFGAIILAVLLLFIFLVFLVVERLKSYYKLGKDGKYDDLDALEEKNQQQNVQVRNGVNEEQKVGQNTEEVQQA